MQLAFQRDTSWEGSSGTADNKAWEWEKIRLCSIWAIEVRGGGVRISSLRVKKAVLHDLTDDGDGDIPESVSAIAVVRIPYEIKHQKILMEVFAFRPTWTQHIFREQILTQASF